MLAVFGLGELLWAMLVFFFWFMLIWMFIATFGDIFRRDDIGGGAKAGWILLIFVLPLLGILIYLAARPRVGGADTMAGAPTERPTSGYSPGGTA